MVIVPFIPSPMEAVKTALSIARIDPSDTLYDLGAGDGRVVIEAAKRGAKAVAVEIDPSLAMLIWCKAVEEKLEDKIEVLNEDFFKVYLGNATIIYQYIYPSISAELAKKYEKELRIGTRIIALDLPIPDWIPVIVKRFIDENGVLRTVFLYIKGISDPGSWKLKINTVSPKTLSHVMGIARNS